MGDVLNLSLGIVGVSMVFAIQTLWKITLLFKEIQTSITINDIKNKEIDASLIARIEHLDKSLYATNKRVSKNEHNIWEIKGDCNGTV